MAANGLLTQFDLVFKKIPGGHGGFNRWTINGKSYPHTDALMVQARKRYRMIFRNESDDAHPYTSIGIVSN